MKRSLKLIGLFCGMFIFTSCSNAQPDHFSVCVKNLKIKNTERIMAFDLNVKGAVFDSLSQIPIGWSYTVSNASSGLTSLKAGVITYSAGLGPSQLGCLASLKKAGFENKVTAELILYVAEGDEDPRPVKVDQSSLVIESLSK